VRYGATAINALPRGRTTTELILQWIGDHCSENASVHYSLIFEWNLLSKQFVCTVYSVRRSVPSSGTSVCSDHDFCHSKWTITIEVENRISCFAGITLNEDMRQPLESEQSGSNGTQWQIRRLRKVKGPLMLNRDTRKLQSNGILQESHKLRPRRPHEGSIVWLLRTL
jgi:hypothetical protein